VPSQWTQVKGRISGVAKSDLPSDRWWRGTAYAQVLILANYGQGKESEVLVDDITMTVVEK